LEETTTPTVAVIPEQTQPQNSGLANKVMRGTLLSLAAQGSVLVASFIATPFVIRLLGPESYGALSLINVFITYLTFSEVGMGMASTKFGGESHARADNNAEGRVIWTSLLIGGLPVLLISLVVLFLAPMVVGQISTFPPNLKRSATLAVQFAAVAFCFRMISGVLNTPQVVRLRMDLVSLLTYGIALAQVGLTPVVIWLGGGLAGALGLAAALAIVGTILNAILSSRLLPEMIKPQIDQALIRPLLVFGGGVVFSTWAAIALANGEKLLLAHFASVRALAHYAVASTLAMTLTQIPVAMSQPLLSAFSRLQAISLSRLQRLYESAVRLAFYLVVPCAAVVCLLARPFFTVWAGPEYGQESTIPLYILMTGTVFVVLSYIAYNLLVALGRTGSIARLHVAELGPYILLASLATYWYGIVGAAAIFSLRAIVSTVAIFIIASRASGFPLSSLVKFKGADLFALFLLLPILGLIFWQQAWFLRALILAVILAAYFALVATKVLTVEERSVLMGVVPFNFKARSQIADNGGSTKTSGIR
jgi:O-antigen/teichoic acid export membrane protein